MNNDHYFFHVISKLSEDDLKILEVLQKSEANISYKAMNKSELQEKANLTEALFRKSLNRLTANLLIDIVSGSKQCPVLITHFGAQAYVRASQPFYTRR